jgi:hypothetical protein
MSATLKWIIELVHRDEVHISEHGYEELMEDGIFVRDLIAGLPGAMVVEDYPDFAKGRCVLVLQRDRDGSPVHAVWGIARGATTPAVLITAYRPDPRRWSQDFLRRRK